MPRSHINPRLVSNFICHEDEARLNEKHATDWLWAFGQFVDHDISQTEVGDESVKLFNWDKFFSFEYKSASW